MILVHVLTAFYDANGQLTGVGYVNASGNDLNKAIKHYLHITL